MYTQGETFYYDINDEEFELHVLENVILGENEYLITEDFDGKIHVFLYNEDEDDVELVEDRREALEIVEYWKDEYLVTPDLGDFEDDEYYDRVDKDLDDDYSDDYDDDYDY